MSTARARLMRRARRYLSIWKEHIGLDNELGLTDINKDAEDFCCGLLNILLEAQLKNLNLFEMNFPAVDLADQDSKVCVQVTSTEGASKITHTLDRFFAHNLDQDYDRLIVMILGKKKQYRTVFPQKENFRFDPTRDIWDITKLLTEIAGLDMVRLNRVDAYLREQFDDLEELTPPMELPVLSALDDFSFLGRDDELWKIAQRFEQGEKIVFLTGLGGMGKSELAARFAHTRWGGESYFVHFTKSWRQTVLENIAPRIRDLNRDGADEERIYCDAMSELKSRGTDELLILDNVDQEAASLTQLKRELSVLNLRILLTTRTDAERSIDVVQLHHEELHLLFDQHEANATPEERDALIEAVDGHTLTVDLMARALRPGRRAATAEKLLNNLADSTIRRVDTAYPGGPALAQIIEHLKVVFKVLGLPDVETELLRYASLLPEGGMDDELFLAPFGGEKQVELDNLIYNGWLIWKDGLLRIHPVIRKVCVEELKPTDENCETFLNGLINQYDETRFQMERYRQMAELLTNASTTLTDFQGKWALKGGERWRDVGNLFQALVCSLRAMEKGELCHSTDRLDLAQIYNNVGVTYGELGDYDKALHYEIKALSIRKKLLPSEAPTLAQSYNNIGSTYGSLGNHRKALEYQQIALTIREKALTPEHPDLATSYNNIGCEHGELGNHRTALEYHLKALAIREKILTSEHPSLATSYNNVGYEHGQLGNHQKALEYHQKALAIRKKVLPSEHPVLAASYNNVAWNYYALGKFLEAVQHMRKAVDIITRSPLPKDHPDQILYQQWANQFEKALLLQQDIQETMSSIRVNPFDRYIK